MVDTDTGEISRVMLRYGKNYDGYWNGEYVAKQLGEVHMTFLNIHGGALALYIFDNSTNHHKIATDDLNAKKLNFKYGGKNTPIMRDAQSCSYNADRRGISKGVGNNYFGTWVVEIGDEEI